MASAGRPPTMSNRIIIAVSLDAADLERIDKMRKDTKRNKFLVDCTLDKEDTINRLHKTEQELVELSSRNKVLEHTTNIALNKLDRANTKMNKMAAEIDKLRTRLKAKTTLPTELTETDLKVEQLREEFLTAHPTIVQNYPHLTKTQCNQLATTLLFTTVHRMRTYIAKKYMAWITSTDQNIELSGRIHGITDDNPIYVSKNKTAIPETAEELTEQQKAYKPSLEESRERLKRFLERARKVHQDGQVEKAQQFITSLCVPLCNELETTLDEFTSIYYGLYFNQFMQETP